LNEKLVNDLFPCGEQIPYDSANKIQSNCNSPVFKIMPVAAVPKTPANTPAVFDMPSKTPEYLGAMSCT